MREVSDYSEIMVITYNATCCYNKVDHNLNYPRLKGYGCVEDVGDGAVEADIFSERANNQKNKIPEMHKMCALTLSYSNPVILHIYNRKQSVGLPAFLSSSFAIWF